MKARKLSPQIPRLFIILFSILLVSACSPLPTPVQTKPQATIEITEIVDQTTLQPVSDNKITLRWKNSAGELIEKQEFHDQADLVTTLPADGKTLLTITIEAPGYATWSNDYRMKLETDQTLSTPVELSKHPGP